MDIFLILSTFCGENNGENILKIIRLFFQCFGAKYHSVHSVLGWGIFVSHDSLFSLDLRVLE